MVDFILLGHGRSGSTLLVKSLDEHPNIRMFGELFNIEEKERCRAFHALNRTYPPDQLEKGYYVEGEDAAEFLRSSVFYPRPWKEIQAVGFKMFYVHARRYPKERNAWDYLIAKRDLHVIHLVRRNLLESFVSLQIARRTKEWKRWKSDTSPVSEYEPFHVDPAILQGYFNEKFTYRQWARRTFRDRPFIEIEYERDVCGDFESVMHRLHDFLRVPRGPARQLLAKQAMHHPCDMIVNYAELKERFRNTLFEVFFE
jgi:LPS sulfotransferase NodH